MASNQEIYQSKLSSIEESMKKTNQEKDAEIKELQSQLRDIMFYLDAQNKMSENKDVTNEEIQDSQMIIQQNADEGASASASARMANRRRRKN